MSRLLSMSCVLLCILSACGSSENTEVEAPTVEVIQGPLVYHSSFYGELQAREKVSIHAPELTGVDFLTVDTVLDDGTRVNKDQAVLQFVRGPLEDELRAKETELAVAQAEMRRVEHDLDKERIDLDLDVRRKRMTVDRAELFVVEGVNLISKLDLEKFKLDVQKAKLEQTLAQRALASFGKKRAAAMEVQRLKVSAVQQEVDEKRLNLSKMEIKAPAEGVLYGPYTRLNWVRGKVAPGSVCRPGDKLLEIPDLSSFDVDLHVRQRDALLISLGAKAKVSPTAAPEHIIDAEVTHKEDFATTRNERLGTKTPEGNLKEIKVKLTLKDALDVMRPGGTVRADLSVVLAEEATLVPLAAISEREGKNFVTMDDGQQREVNFAQTSLTHAAIMKGLEPGERVRLATK